MKQADKQTRIHFVWRGYEEMYVVWAIKIEIIKTKEIKRMSKLRNSWEYICA
jgi:hypothetical protein